MNRRGMTMIEIVIVMALMVILTSVYFLIANPGGQLALARNSERTSQLQSLMLAIRQNIADQSNEKFSCTSGSLPTSSARMTSRVGAGNYNIAPCIVSATGIYGLFTMPFDPSATSSYFNSVTDYDSAYNVMQNASGSITVSAPSAELKQVISITR